MCSRRTKRVLGPAMGQVTVKWITELGRQLRELGRNVHLVGWLGLGAGSGGWGTLAVLFVCLLLHSIGFMLFIAKVRAETWARTPETLASDFARDYTACFYCRQVSVFTTSDLVEIAWMLQK